jgi:hypothetical protein
MYKKTLLPLLFAIGFSIQIGFAQWPQDTTNNIKVCQASSDQQYPESVSDGAGGAIIVWQDGRGGSNKIYAQRIDSSGILRWATNGIVISTADNSLIPKITSDGVGGAIIAWFDRRIGWPYSSIAIQRVNGNGDTLWQENGVILADSVNSWAYPEITGYGSNGSIVTWIGYNGEIYAQKIDTAGIVQWPDTGVLVAPEGGLPHITTDGSGGAIITWFDYDPEHTYTHVFAQRVNAEGITKWLFTGDTICYAPRYQFHPDLLPDGKGGAIIGWLDNRFETSNYPFAQRVDSMGEPYWTKNGKQTSTTNGYYRVGIVSDGAGGAYLAWMGGSTADIYIQRIDTNGNPQWTSDIRLSENTNPTIPGIISDGSTGAFVIWQNPAVNQVKVQHISSSGTLSFGVGGKTVSLGNNLNGYFSAVTDGKGSTIVTWDDMPYYDRNICTQRVVVPGFTTGVSEDEDGKTVPREFTLNQNFPNPFNPTTTITFTLIENGHVSLKVFDVLGREITTLVNAQLNAGEIHRAMFDASQFSTGIYFYRIETEKNVLVKKLMLVK